MLHRLLLSLSVCLLFAQTIWVDPIVITSGTVTMPAEASFFAHINNVGGPGFSFPDGGHEGFINGLGTFNPNSVNPFFGSFETTNTNINQCTPSNVRFAPHFTFNGVDYCVDGGGWAFHGTAVVNFSTVGEFDVQAPFTLTTGSLLYGRPLSDLNQLVIFSGNLLGQRVGGVLLTFTPEPCSSADGGGVEDTDGDGQPNCLDADDDDDGILDNADNCPLVVNAEQSDVDDDEIGDACDLEIGPPTKKDQCKNNGWQLFNFPRRFNNQGDCIQFINTGK